MKLKEPLVFVTSNMNKVKWVQRYIHVPMTHKKLELTEIQSLDVKEVVEHKVKEAYKLLKQPVLVEDTSLVFHELGKLPGPLIKWFLEELGNERLCQLVKRDNKATVTVLFGLYDGTHLHFCEGVVNGTISPEPLGTNGFGWNPLFIPDGKTKTYAQMTDEEIDDVSPRRLALEKLREII